MRAGAPAPERGGPCREPGGAGAGSARRSRALDAIEVNAADESGKSVKSRRGKAEPPVVLAALTEDVANTRTEGFNRIIKQPSVSAAASPHGRTTT